MSVNKKKLLTKQKTVVKPDAEYITELQDIIDVLVEHMSEMGKQGLVVNFSLNNSKMDEVTLNNLTVTRNVPIPERVNEPVQ